MVVTSKTILLHLFVLTTIYLFSFEAKSLSSYLIREKRDNFFNDLLDYMNNDDTTDDSIGDFMAPIKSFKESMDKEFDKYPDNFNKTFTKVKTENGIRTETNKTIYKQTKNNSFMGYIEKIEAVNGHKKLRTLYSVGNNGGENTDTGNDAEGNSYS